MEFMRCEKASFSVIGKEGSSRSGAGFVQPLWAQANGHFDEVAGLARYTQEGLPEVWGAMTDFSRSFKPWENGYTEGMYLAGVEVSSDAQPPEGWVKWSIPAFSYVYVKVGAPDTFAQGLAYLKEHNLTLCGAVQEYYCVPEGGQMYLFFPVFRKQTGPCRWFSAYVLADRMRTGPKNSVAPKNPVLL